jgi:hypothetical protein
VSNRFDLVASIASTSIDALIACIAEAEGRMAGFAR